MTAQPITKFLFVVALITLSLTPLATAEEDPDREGGLTGTGIVGEITALGSIVVNGQRITFAPDQEVANAVALTQAADLLPGDIVAVAVTPAAQDWGAVAIRQVHALVGPVSAASAGEFTLLDVAVQWQGPSPAVGDWIAVSGFWTGDGVIATRVQPIAPRGTAQIVGSYGADTAGAATKVGTLTLDLPLLQHASEGDVIEVTGTIADGQLSVTDIKLGLFDMPVSVVLAEGYLTDIAPSGHYTVAGSGLSAYTDNQQSIMETDRIRVCGADGQLGLPDDLILADIAERLGCPAAAN